MSPAIFKRYLFRCINKYFLLYSILSVVFFQAGVLHSRQPVINIQTPELSGQPIGRSMNYLVDKTSSLEVAEIRNLAEERWQEVQSHYPGFRFTDDTYWVRLRFENLSQKSEPAYLELAYPVIDDVLLYCRPEMTVRTPLHLGDRLRFHLRPIEHRNFIMPVLIPPGQSECLLRVQTQSSMNLYLRFWYPIDFHETASWMQMLMGFYYGIMLVMVLYNFFIFLGIRDISYLYYVFYILGYLIYQFTLNGHAFQYVWPESVEWANACLPFFMCHGSFWGLMFADSFLGTRQRNPGMHRIFQIMLVVHLVFISISLFMPYGPMIRIATALIILSVLTILTAGVLSYRAGNKSARYFVLAWSFLITGILLFALKTFGVLPSNSLTIWSQQYGSAFEVILLSLALADRINIIKREKDQAQQDSINNLRRSDRMKDEFLARTSHELRTPLNGIIGLAESSLQEIQAAGTIDQEALRDNMRILIASGRRLSGLVNDVLDFARIRNSDIQLQIGAVNLTAMLELVGLFLKPSIEQKGLQLKLSVAPELPLIRADEDRLQQILLNLLENALKFTPYGSIEIRAQFEKTDGEVSIGIIDTGIGIKPEQHQEIFESFSQMEDSLVRSHSGTGLGLAMVRSLLELHGSKIEVKSEPGKGSHFYFRLPISETQDSVSQAALPLAQSNILYKNSELGQRHEVPAFKKDQENQVGDASRSQKSNGKMNQLVMIVDDEPVNVLVLENYLKHCNYAVVRASDGYEALEKIAEQTPDIILLDLMMPRLSGYEVLQKLRQDFSPTELPVVILSARNQVSDLVQGLELGANDYLTKPFSREELLARLETHLNLRNSVERQLNQSKAFQRFVPARFLDLMGKRDVTEVELGDARSLQMSVLFSDIRHFTEIAETMPADECIDFLNAYLQRMEPDIQRNGGFVDKYMGDAIMALFPEDAKNKSASMAIQAALDMQRELKNFNRQQKQKGRPPIAISVAVHTGELMLGTVGSPNRLDTTVIGDPVNLASRLENLNRIYGTNILISDMSYRQLQEHEQKQCREIDAIIVKGKNKPIVIYDLFAADHEDEIAAKLAMQGSLQQGLVLYKSRSFVEALEIFLALAAGIAEDVVDPVVRMYIQRCQDCISNPPDENWQAVERLVQK